MDELLITYAGQAAYAMGCFLIGWLWRSLKISRRDYTLIREGVCALLRERLLHRIEDRIEEGWCSTAMKDDIIKMNKIYRALGGNGAVPPLMHKLDDLPLKPKRSR